MINIKNIMVAKDNKIQMITLREIHDLDTLSSVVNKEDLPMSLLKKLPDGLKYVREQTPEISLEFVGRNSHALEYVKEQTDEICLSAVAEDGISLSYVKKQTYEICLEAVKQNGYALSYVKEQTPEICLAAVKNDYNSLQFVKKQTYEICLEAVKQNCDTLSTIKDIKIRNMILDKLKPISFNDCLKKYGNDIADDLLRKYKKFGTTAIIPNKEIKWITDEKITNEYIFKHYPMIKKYYDVTNTNVKKFDRESLYKILDAYYIYRIDGFDKTIKLQQDNELQKILSEKCKMNTEEK